MNLKIFTLKLRAEAGAQAGAAAAGASRATGATGQIGATSAAVVAGNPAPGHVVDPAVASTDRSGAPAAGRLPLLLHRVAEQIPIT